VTFRVDAYPTEDFQGTVAQIRLQPVVVQNVTTYGTIINVPNPELKLKPGMTANLKVQIAKRTDVLRVPNAALRFRPSPDVFAALNQPVPPEAAGGGRGGRGGRNGQNAQNAPGPSTAPPSASAGANGPTDRGHGGAPGGDAGQGGDRQARMKERFKTMSPDEQKQFIAPSTIFTPKYGAAQSADTIDQLFAPLPPVESRGRAWVYMDKQLKPVQLRLGITDGTNTELLSGELQPGMELVTGVIMSGSTGRPTAGGGSGNPLMPGRGGFGGPGRGR